MDDVTSEALLYMGVDGYRRRLVAHMEHLAQEIIAHGDGAAEALGADLAAAILAYLGLPTTPVSV